MEVADRGRWPEQRDDPVLDQGPQDEHVVALVGIPRAPGREVREAHEARQDEQHDQRDPVRHRARAPQRGRQRHEAAPVGVGSAGPVRALLPRIVIASGGSSGSGLPAARSYARATLTASYPSSIPGVSR